MKLVMQTNDEAIVKWSRVKLDIGTLISGLCAYSGKKYQRVQHLFGRYYPEAQYQGNLEHKRSMVDAGSDKSEATAS